MAEAADLSRRVNSLKQKRRRLERSLSSLNNKLSSFIDNNRHTFTNKLVDTRSTTDVLLSSTKSSTESKEREIVQELDKNVQLLIEKFSRLIIEARHASSGQ